MRKTALLLLLAILLSACPRRGTDGRPLPVEPGDTDRCVAGRARLKELGCPEASGSDPSDPESCRRDCEYVQTDGLVHLRPSCWETMTSCSQLETQCSP